MGSKRRIVNDVDTELVSKRPKVESEEAPKKSKKAKAASDASAPNEEQPVSNVQSNGKQGAQEELQVEDNAAKSTKKGKKSKMQTVNTFDLDVAVPASPNPVACNGIELEGQKSGKQRDKEKKKDKKKADGTEAAPEDLPKITVTSVVDVVESDDGKDAKKQKSTKEKKTKRDKTSGPEESKYAEETEVACLEPEEMPKKVKKKKVKADELKADYGEASRPSDKQEEIPTGVLEETDAAALKKAKKEAKKKKKEQQSLPAEETAGPLEPVIPNGKASNTSGLGKEQQDLPPPPPVVSPSAGGDGAETRGKAFQRVKADEWLGKKGSINNSYEATFGQSGWGFKAQQVLGAVRGKDFRHEKTKKKRGSYRGGAIDPAATFSFKFDDNDE